MRTSVALGCLKNQEDRHAMKIELLQLSVHPLSDLTHRLFLTCKVFCEVRRKIKSHCTPTKLMCAANYLAVLFSVG
jgi:hypothetical protein